MRSAVRLPTPGRGLQARGVPHRQRARQLARRRAGQHGQRDLRPDVLHADEQQEEVALLLGGEAVEVQGVLAHDEVRVQRDLLADGGHAAQRLGGHREAVADAGGEHDDVVGAADRDLATHHRNHALIAFWRRACSGARLTWQTATASASDAWSAFGMSVRREQRLDHAADLLLARATGAADGALDLLRRVGGARDRALPGREQHDAARLADRERRAGVVAEEEVLDRDGVRLVLVDELGDPRVDVGEAALQRRARRRLDHAGRQRRQAPGGGRHHAVARVGGAGIDAEDAHAARDSASRGGRPASEAPG